MPTTRATSSQNRHGDDNVPPQFEDLPLMSTERLYSYIGNLAGLVEFQAKGFGNNG